MSDAGGGERIRSFSRVTWILGSVIVMGIGAIAFPTIYRDAAGDIYVASGDDLDDLETSPWLQEEPVELEAVDGRIDIGPQGGYLELDPETPAMTVTAELDDEEYASARQSVGTWNREDYALPSRVGWFAEPDDVGYVVVGPDGGRLWFDATGTRWGARLEPLETEPLDGEAAGTGPANLLYKGDALSARFIHTGAGILQVTLIAPGEDARMAVNAVDDVDTRASWDRPGIALMVIDATGDGEWTVAVDE